MYHLAFRVKIEQAVQLAFINRVFRDVVVVDVQQIDRAQNTLAISLRASFYTFGAFRLA